MTLFGGLFGLAAPGLLVPGFAGELPARAAPAPIPLRASAPAAALRASAAPPPALRSALATAWLRAASAPPPALAASAPASALRASSPPPPTLRGSTLVASTGFFTIHQGDAVSPVFTLDGLPATAGWATAFTLFAPDGTVALTKTPAADTPGQGQLTVNLARADTATRTPGSYPFELHRTDAGSEGMLALGAVEILYARLP